MEKKWKNKKNGKIYSIENDFIINATNAQDGQVMVLYRNDEGKLFVRDKAEFLLKFFPAPSEH